MIIENKCSKPTPHYVTWSEKDIEGNLEKYFTTKEEAILFYEENGKDSTKGYKLYLDNKEFTMPNIDINECEMIIDKGSKTWDITRIDGEVSTSKLNL